MNVKQQICPFDLALSHLKTFFDAIATDAFLNIVAKVKIAHDEQFLLWPKFFQLYLTIKLYFMETIQTFVTLLSKLSAADLLYVGKG